MSEPTVDLVLRPTGRRGSRGEIYEALLGSHVIASGTSPECASCRVLKELGFAGYAQFWREGRRRWDIRMPIEWGATKQVIEGNGRPRFSDWSPFDREAIDG